MVQPSAATPAPITREERIALAMQMIDLGFALFALKPMSKEPWTQDGFKSATRDKDAVRKFLSNPGATSYGMVWPEDAPGDPVLEWDVDGADWRERMEGMAAQYGALPKSIRTKSPHGFHLFYRCSPQVAAIDAKGVKNKMLGFVVRKPWKGYVVGPGSVTNDGEYRLQGAPHIAHLPEAWQRAALAEAGQHLIVVKGAEEGPGYEVPATVGEGDRYAQIVSYTAHLYNTGITVPEMEALVRTQLLPKMQPPLDEAGFRERFRRATDGMAKRLGERHAPGSRSEAPAGSQRLSREDYEAQTYIEIAPARLGEFPKAPADDVWGGVAGIFTSNMKEVTVGSEIGILSSLLTFWAGMHGVTFTGWEPMPTNLFTVLVGKTGAGRKGTTVRAVWGQLEKALRLAAPASAAAIRLPGPPKGSWAKRWDGFASGQGIIAHMAAEKGNDPAKPIHGCSVEEEFDTVLQAAQSNRSYTSNLGQTFQKLFDGQMVANRTAKDPKVVIPPYTISILGNITPESLRRNLSEDMVQRGFANRFLLVPVVGRPDEEVTNPGGDIHPDVAQMLRDAHEWWEAGNVPIVPTTVRATMRAYEEHLKGLAGMQWLFAQRYHVLALRVAVVHAMLDCSPKVTDDHVWAGIALTEYCRRGLSWCMTDASGDEWLDALVNALRARGPEGLRGTEVARLLKSDAPRIHRVKSLGLETGLITIERAEPTGKAGRPVELYRLAESEPLKEFLRGSFGISSSTPSRARGGSTPVPVATTTGTGTTTQKEGVEVEIIPTNTETTMKLPLSNPNHPLRCHFYSEHTSIHRLAKCESFHCDACSPYPEGCDDPE